MFFHPAHFNAGEKDPAYRQWQWENGENHSNIAEAATKYQSGDGIIWKDMGFDLKTILTNPASGDYTPVGDALNGDYSSLIQDKVADIFKSYPNDINGNPRVVNGKVAIGAYAAK